MRTKRRGSERLRIVVNIGKIQVEKIKFPENTIGMQIKLYDEPRA
jgi:hypothetical protein